MPTPFDIASISFPDGSELPRLVAESHGGIECLKFLDEEYLLRAGEQRQDVFLIVKGSCLVQRDGATGPRRSGDELAIIEATPDAPVFVGETAYLAGGARTASVRSSLSVWALRMEPTHLDFIIARYPDLTRTLCRQFAQRLKETNAALAAVREQQAMNITTTIAGNGETIFYKGDPAEALYIVADGVVDLEGPNGFTEVRATSAGPAFLNPAAYLRGTANTHTAIASGTVYLNAISAASRHAAIRNFPQLVDSLLNEG